MKLAAIWLATLGLVAALSAARYWYLSSKTKVPVFYITAAGAYEAAIEEVLRKSASLNKVAAIWMAVASILGAISSVAGSIPIE